MGYARWSSDAYAHLRASYAKKSSDDIFVNNRKRALSPAMDPSGLTFRESRDSEAHPHSLAIAVFLDVTGSMGHIPEQLIRHKLGALMDTLAAHGVESPQVLFSAIGDHLSDRAPLQVGQFESGAHELSHCLSSVFIERGGGGQNMESYLLAWLVAGRHTSIDCFEKRGAKGFLFTIGDEKSWDRIEPAPLQAIMGYPESPGIRAEEVLAQAQRMYHVFHIHVNETGYRNNPEVIGYWRGLLGERLLILDDHNAIADLIAATVAAFSGVELDRVASGFDAATAASVRHALAAVPTGIVSTTGKGVIRL